MRSRISIHIQGAEPEDGECHSTLMPIQQLVAEILVPILRLVPRANQSRVESLKCLAQLAAIARAQPSSSPYLRLPIIDGAPRSWIRWNRGSFVLELDLVRLAVSVEPAACLLVHGVVVVVAAIEEVVDVLLAVVDRGDFGVSVISDVLCAYLYLLGCVCKDSGPKCERRRTGDDICVKDMEIAFVRFKSYAARILYLQQQAPAEFPYTRGIEKIATPFT
ncbi:hypothetical protein K505DRAFT_419762 [Melanomma pulvis-pyrius CBS 109.77]|uniref:Uncharacterized protein n=1 Tax=Melanomma pulvis-pyrius CBS 109.77 TaxID=1314802 RepID=A0A6A6X2V8_9PLEO|nr:hypothetical protein K505DRAFT_419762 [Melanomma pulvis-pyrius CBS 109.77]